MTTFSQSLPGARNLFWDDLPDALAAPDALPGNHYRLNAPFDVAFSIPGTGFQISANRASGDPVEFGNLNPTYPTLFEVFTSDRLFTPLGSTVTDVSFFLPGTGTPAATSGFGAIFVDVDLPGSSSLELFDPDGTSLGRFVVAPSATAADPNETLSFLGVRFDAGEQIGRVRITSGNGALGSRSFEAGVVDLVALDDGFYAQPQAARVPGAVPLPSTGWLLIAPLAAVAAAHRRRAGRREIVKQPTGTGPSIPAVPEMREARERCRP